MGVYEGREETAHKKKPLVTLLLFRFNGDSSMHHNITEREREKDNPERVNP